jgi:hypothetical protein
MAAVVEKKRQPLCPYLPPEIWHRIFLQNTYPNDLWHVGRQVCSMWRTEIPKVFAKKYLENPNMLQIYYDCGMTGIAGCLCDMNAEMVFDRYEGANRLRCVFAENPLTTGAENRGLGEENDAEYRRQKYDNWRADIEFYLGVRRKYKKKERASPAGGFQRRIHQVRFKARANDTALPGLEFDFARREISFEWRRMFDAFCSEAVLLEERERGLLAGSSEQWLNEGKHSMAGDLAFSNTTKAARFSIAKEVRHERIERWHHIDFEFKDALFDVKSEQYAIWALKWFEARGDFVRCAEDEEERMIADLMLEFRKGLRSEYMDVGGELADDEDSS